MDSSMDPFADPAFVNVSIENGNVSNNTELPPWLNDILGRLFTGSGIPNRKKLASEKAISELKNVDIDTVKDDKCSICFEKYDEPPKNDSKPASIEGMTLDQAEALAVKFDRLSKQQDEILEKLTANASNSIESNASKSRFNDPSLFFPADVGGAIPYRFPSRNISTMVPVSEERILTGLKQDHKKDAKNAEDCHNPVKMPGCNHIFGKSCIVEWLKSNVSCPLCRREVESETDQSGQEARVNRVRLQLTSTFNSNSDSNVAEHVLSNLTNVFRPFRRPPNPLITPLTDSYTLQSWATPSYPPREGRRVSTRDPSLVLPRRFPINIPDHSLNQVRPPVMVAPLRVSSTTRPIPAPTSLLSPSAPSNDVSSEGTPEPSNDSTSSFSSTGRGNGLGGPERRRGNGTGRTHPYNRP